MFRLVHAPVRRVALRDLLALAEVALALPDDRRRRGVSRLLPLDVAVVLADAVEGPVEGGEVNVAVGEDGGRDDLAFDRLFPVFLPGPEVEAGEVMLMVAVAVGVSHVDPPWRRPACSSAGRPATSSTPAPRRR